MPTKKAWRKNKRWDSFSACERLESSAYVTLNIPQLAHLGLFSRSTQGRGLAGFVSTQRARFAFGKGCDCSNYVNFKIGKLELFCQ
jgi:hypothetical protein